MYRTWLEVENGFPDHVHDRSPLWRCPRSPLTECRMFVAFALAELVGGTVFLARNGSNCHGVPTRANCRAKSAGFTSVVQKMGAMAQYPVLTDHRVPEKKPSRCFL